ncbi:FAD-dependent monooxygenase [Actinopolyspora mortivallis]|uniref:FAD-dependent oxidoreductase n=1 Tax=Actinopolyspora mortivallis TaxID=33906 RepID=A0A2T0GWQ4_ACTMO|nr:FAD-dependent monooxygenase [Actinopolyspora mortivallis]PRW63524.1 FAD-dependent oxidoreductase [Actinopolyspora mortivallis]
MRVVVCGAGIAGLTLANRIAAFGGDVVLLERSPRPREQGYMIDFFGPGYRAVEAMGLLPAVERISYEFEEASLLDRHGRRRAGAHPKQFTSGDFLNVMRPDLESVLWESLPATVETRFGTSPVAVREEDGGVRVAVEDGTEIGADLLVGADGIHSTVRRLVFGAESRFLRHLGLHTTAFLLDSPEVRDRLGERFCLTDTLGRQLGLYALRDGRVAVFGVHRARNSGLPEDPRTAVRRVYAGLGWVVPEVLRQCPPSEEIYYDQVAQSLVPSWSNGRVVLLGDACYAVSLLAGQGASLASGGAYLLAERLAKESEPERALVEYERLWRPVVEEKQRAGRAGADWFLPESSWALWLRRTVLGMTRFSAVNRRVGEFLLGRRPAARAEGREAPELADLLE